MAESVTVDTLEIEIESRAKGVFTNLDALADSMTRLKAAVKGGAGLTAVKNQLESLNTSLNGININTGKIGELATALGSLSTVQKASGLTSTINALKKLPQITESLNATDLNAFGAKMREVAAAVGSLSTVQKASGLTSTINALKKLPQITASLNATDLNAFGAKMREVAAAVRPLAEEMQKVSNGFSAFPSRIQKLITQNERLKVSNNKTAKSFNNVNKFSLTTLANLSAYTYVLKRITNFLADSVKSVNDYIENVNLFQVSMGEFYDEAFEYAMLVNEKLGIDPSEWMRNQGVFMAMANGFGLAKKQAYDLSKSLTELSYDISSLYNEDMERAAQRLQSALAGEIEPIRRLGISISQATLEEYALSKGIKESVANMTEQEKALLRSLKLIEGAQNIGAIGDFAKTLESPANAMRVLNQQLTQFSRAIGSVFLPVIVQVLPYLQAFVSLLTDAIKALAASAGFVMPDWDNKKWSNNIVDGALGAEDALQDATKAAKELKNATLGIDELNILSPQDKAGNGASGSDWASTLTIPNLWDKKALEQIKTQAAEIKEKLKPVFDDILQIVGMIGVAIGAWKIGKSVASFFEMLQGFKGAPLSVLGSLTLGGLGIALETEGIIDAIKDGLDGIDFSQILSGGGLITVAGTSLGKMLGSAFIGGGIGAIIAGVPAFITGVYDALVNGINWLNSTLTAFGATAAGAGIGVIIGALGGPIGAGIGALIGLAVGLLTDFGIWLSQNWENISANLSSWWNGTVLPFLQTIPNKIGEIVNSIQMWFDSLPEKIGYGLGYALGAIVDWVNSAIEWFKSLPSKMYEALTAGITTITIWGSQLIAKAQEVLPKVVEKVVDVFKSIPGKLRELGGSIVSGLLEGIKSSYESLKEDFNSFVNGFVQGFKDALGIHSPSTVFAEIGNNVVAGLMNGLGFFTNVLGTVKEWGGNIIEWFNKGEDTKSVVDSFKDTAESLVAGFRDTLTTKYIDSRSAVTSWASGVKQWFSEIASPNVFAQVAVSIVNGFKDSIINQYGTVKSAMAEFGNAVIDAFERPNGRRSIVTEFEIIGTNVIEGFIEGTSSLWDEAERVIRAFAANIIDSAMEELNENSPSKVFREIGMNVVRGFNIGIEREEAASLNVMNSWLTGVKDVIPSFGVGFEMDYSNIKSFNPESFTQGISANMTASGTATVVGFKEAMEEFYSEMLYPMISQIADDMRRQADKEEKTVVNIGNRTVTEAVSAQQSANGYRFVTT